MRRLARPLFTLCSEVSLILCAATVVLWLSSYRTTRQVGVVRPPYRVYLCSSDGIVRLSVGNSTGETLPAEFVEPAGWVLQGWPTPDRSSGSVWEELPSHLRGRMGFHLTGDRFATLQMTSGVFIHRTGDRLYLPHWAFALLTGTLPAIWLRRRLRARNRRDRGLCRHCGYDLRASPGRCPECGTVTPTGGSA